VASVPSHCIILSVALAYALTGCVQASSAGDPVAVTAQLIRLLSDPSPDVRQTAALSLGKIGRAEAAIALVEALDDADPLVRQHSAWALGSVGEDALDPAGMALVRALEDPSPSVKAAAARALGEVGGTQAMIELVTEALHHPEAATRQAAVQALAGLEAASARPALLTALDDPDARVRQGAIAALGELADASAIPHIGRRLLKDPDPGVRAEAAFRLGKLGGPTEASMLRKAAAGDGNAEVRRWANWALDVLRSS
jgi:HEAT repeat protein